MRFLTIASILFLAITASALPANPGSAHPDVSYTYTLDCDNTALCLQGGYHCASGFMRYPSSRIASCDSSCYCDAQCRGTAAQCGN